MKYLFLLLVVILLVGCTQEVVDKPEVVKAEVSLVIEEAPGMEKDYDETKNVKTTEKS